jgi:cation diffusion facilitator CzcD-associated flavoprotein CzcO
MVPNKPKMFDSFEGKVIHTAKWDNSVDMRNKRVAVIGSGARYEVCQSIGCSSTQLLI